MGLTALSNTRDATESFLDEMSEIATIARGPWGLLAQFATAGYVLAAFLLYRCRRRFFHPDVINVRGALVGVLLWVLLESLSWLTSGGPLGALPLLGPLLVVSAIGSILGRAQWILVARRAQRHRDSLTKWEFKTRASAAVSVALAAVIGAILAPYVTGTIAVLVAVAALLRPRRRNGRGAAVVSTTDAHAPATEDGPSISQLRPGEFIVSADLSSRAAARAALGGLLRLAATAASADLPIERVLVRAASARSKAEGSTEAIGGPAIVGIRRAAEIPGVSVVGEPVLQPSGGDGGIRVIVAVRVDPGIDEVVFGLCAEAIAEALPRLGEVWVCVQA